ncbi:MAG: hypothetical protein EP329_11855, partial [Deltaproteobacteria bacterium]
MKLDGVAPSGVTTAALPGHPELSRVRFSVAGGNHRVSADGDFQLGLVTAASGTGLFAYYNPFRVPGCGDGTVDANEACDDGNVEPGDGCSPQCRLEIGETGCEGDADCVAAAFCQDGTCVARCFTTADCADGDPCTADLCDDVTGACSNTALPVGSDCDGGVCDPGGSCVACYFVGDPGVPDPGCNVEVLYCDERDGALGCHGCVDSAGAGAVDAGCDADRPVCDEASDSCGVCLVDADCADDDPCTHDTCQAGACEHVGVAAGSACEDDAGGVCDAS